MFLFILIVFTSVSDALSSIPHHHHSFLYIGFALNSAFSVSYMMLVVMRTIVGIGIGGIGVPFDLLAEMMPPHNRGRALYGIEFFWLVHNGMWTCHLLFSCFQPKK